MPALDYAQIKTDLQQLAKQLGFQKLGVCDTDLVAQQPLFDAWLERGFQADMAYLERNTLKRIQPSEWVSGACRVICVRMDYLPVAAASPDWLNHPRRAYVARYALGRDYHRLIRKRLQRLANALQTKTASQGYRVFCDSAPVLEKALAQKAGLGWIGKNTLLLDKRAGSWFFLGEIYTDVPLPVDVPLDNHCGRCQACLDICPTQALVAPYQLDARRCIAYLTIENKGPIPLELRALMGNRIFGCDDCQWICPWNRFATPTTEAAFVPRHGLVTAELLLLLQWTPLQFEQRTQGSAIRRAGYWGWLRNISVALGNAPYSEDIVVALQSRLPVVQAVAWLVEHFHWAIAQQLNQQGQSRVSTTRISTVSIRD
jgi:epoxyqueuosine reductase